ncbi:MAG: hypothetical protein KF805_12650 [Phycisphaeraceae bacterium]|nr:hypothetical protein [Phycisphaeraceae bacterium]
MREFCPYGVPGDRLWVKETHYRWTGCGNPPSGFILSPDGNPYKARCHADHQNIEGLDAACAVLKRSSLFMPRWASRITLEIVSVRVERADSISDADAVAESFRDREDFFRTFYDLNKRAPSGSNPWVWALTFKRVGGEP